MDKWKELKIAGISNIEKVVAEFNIWSLEKIPYGKFKVKVIENKKGGFIGIPNVRIKNSSDGSIDGISGLGTSIDEALEDTLIYLMDLVNDYEKKYKRELTEEDFEWSSPEDF